MTRPVPVATLRRLIRAGNQAGLRLEDIISFLRAGITVEKLLELIESGLIKAEPSETDPQRWIM
jgi:hypothetical protein